MSVNFNWLSYIPQEFELERQEKEFTELWFNTDNAFWGFHSDPQMLFY